LADLRFELIDIIAGCQSDDAEFVGKPSNNIERVGSDRSG
jgi:hypothetical protein